MKRISLISSILALLVLLCACGSAIPVVTSAPQSTDAAGIKPDIAPPVEVVPEETSVPENTVAVTLFLPNSNADGFDEKQADILSLDAQSLLSALAKEGVLPEGIEVLAFTQSGSALSLDLSDGFSKALIGRGTAGETMLIGSVVNTFLSAFGAQQISITVNGAAFETGHSIYDFPFEHING